MTLIDDVQPAALDQTKVYRPPAVKPVIVVLGSVGVVIVAEPGLAPADHVPTPTAAIVTVPPGRVTQVRV